MGAGSRTEQNAASRAKRKKVDGDRRKNNVRVKRHMAKKKDEERKAAKNAIKREQKRNLRKRKKAEEEEADAEEENQSTGDDVEMQDSAASTPAVSDDEVAEEILQDFNDMVEKLKESFERVKSEAKKHYIEMTSADVDGEWHRAPVCVVCDRFIIEFDNITWVKKEVLLKHVHRLGRHAFEVHNAMVLPDSLKKQYMVEDDELKHLLLSPRARRREDDGSYMCCKQCSDSLRDHMLKSSSPPRHAIANELVIGCIPEDILSEEEITDVLAAMLATVRPFIHVVSFSLGGNQKQ
jgi:flagellar biosynthesis GTPase FlhF